MAIILQKVNVNPKGRKTCDCVVRAIASAENKNWKDVLIDLTEYSLKYGYMVNDKKNFQKYLKDLGYEKLPMPKDENGKKVKLKSFKYDSDKIYLVGIKQHLTCVKKGVLIDDWDCSEKYILNIWCKKI